MQRKAHANADFCFFSNLQNSKSSQVSLLRSQPQRLEAVGGSSIHTSGVCDTKTCDSKLTNSNAPRLPKRLIISGLKTWRIQFTIFKLFIAS